MQDAEEWVRAHVEPTGPPELVHARPWATVTRVPTAEGPVWFKQCAPVQAFEVRLSAGLSARWPDRVAQVLAHDDERAWLLLADAGTRLWDLGNPPEAWLDVLPLYAELQRGEAARAADHVAHGVPDLRLSHVAAGGTLAPLCAELAAAGIPDSIQHDDLHMGNVYGVRVLDWGDSSVAHPFFSPWETFRFLEAINGLAPGDPWFARLRDAYLEPWGPGLVEAFDLAQRVAGPLHVLAWQRQRGYLAGDDLADFDRFFPVVIERALRGVG
jgi:hypothetical protein